MERWSPLGALGFLLGLDREPKDHKRDSVDDLKSSCSVRGIRMPDFEVLDAKDYFSTGQSHP